jgi:outer membrane protein assembly factor BamB
VLALDRATGKELWRREVPRRNPERLENVNGPASPSPVTDGERVYAFFQSFGLVAFTTDGNELWRTPLGPFNMFYGFGASPILVDGTLILPVDQDAGSYLLGIDPKTGRQRYRVDRPGVISGYSTPTVYQPKDGGKQILIPESFQLSAYDARDGHRVWWVRGLACEMKSVASIEGDTAWINGWGFPQNQPGQQVPTIAFDEALKVYDKNKDGLIAED